MMKILHLMREEKFTKPIVNFYNVHFNNGEHSICYITKQGRPSQIAEAVTIEQREFWYEEKINFRALKKIIKNYDFVVFHSLFVSTFAQLIWILDRKLMKKTIWIEWGFDLYNYLFPNTNLKNKIKNRILNCFRNDVKTVVGIFPPDCDYYKEQFPKSKANVFYAPYCGAVVEEEYRHYQDKDRLSISKANQEPIYIQVGHNALSSLNHMAVLDALTKYKEENIRILLPLSYGDLSYADRVQKKAEELFGDKVICLRKMMPRDKYFELINRVDIAIFNTERQCGLGNIKRMIFRNVKLYMPEESVMYRYFSSQGVPVQRFENIENFNFSLFVSNIKVDDEELFKNYIESFSNMETKIRDWNTIYDSLR